LHALQGASLALYSQFHVSRAEQPHALATQSTVFVRDHHRSGNVLMDLREIRIFVCLSLHLDTDRTLLTSLLANDSRHVSRELFELVL
jgi:hypothetical protein